MKIWTSAKIRKLAQKKARSNQPELDQDLVLEPDLGSDTELKGVLSYWNRFEDSYGDRVLVVVSSAEADLETSEIERLAQTLGLEVVARYAVRSEDPDPATYLGTGQLTKLRRLMQTHKVGAVIFDVPLRPSQVKNLEKSLKLAVVDRHALILSIFEAHAKTRLAKLQVELAQMKYLLPRLSGMWSGLSRQRGGRGGLKGRGLGETRLELDRRSVKDRIALLSKKLKQAETHFHVSSARRSHLPRVALVGYTNAGKSTLMEQLTGAPVLVADKLFATLDTTLRALRPPTQPQIVVSDTVGFVRDLPHDLVACFKSTLAEATQSRLILLVVDASAPDYLQQLEVSVSVLEEIGAGKIPKLLVLNKCDKLKVSPRLRESQVRRVLKDDECLIGLCSVSALRGEGLEGLKKMIRQECGVDLPEWAKDPLPQKK